MLMLTLSLSPSARDYPRPYLLPLSHPQFFRRSPQLLPARTPSVATATFLSQTRALACILDTYAQACRGAGTGMGTRGGGVVDDDKEELGQAAEDLFNARDAYGYFD